MNDRDNDKKEKLVFKCPTCGLKVEISEKDADEKGVARCAKGHEFALAKML